MLIYKIKTSEGLYSTGGTYPNFTKKGKNWTNIGHLKNHINQLGPASRKRYHDLEVDIVTYELVETVLESISFVDILADIDTKQAEKQAAFKARQEAYRKQQRLQEYEKLKKEFEP